MVAPKKSTKPKVTEDAKKSARTTAKKSSAKAAEAIAAKTFKIVEPKVTHPERVIYPKEKITKLQVAQYYAAVAPHLLPHLADRPLSLLRCTAIFPNPAFS